LKKKVTKVIDTNTKSQGHPTNAKPPQQIIARPTEQKEPPKNTSEQKNMGSNVKMFERYFNYTRKQLTLDKQQHNPYQDQKQ